MAVSDADLLSTLIVILAWQNLQSAEIEASYMWGLIDHSFLAGDSRYFLMTLSSAVDRLKAVRKTIESMSLGHGIVSACQSSRTKKYIASVFLVFMKLAYTLLFNCCGSKTTSS